MKKKNVKTIGYSICLILLLAYPWISNHNLRGDNNELVAAVAGHRKELAGKEQRIADLTSTNKTLEALIRQQKKLIEGESLYEFMALYEKNRVAKFVEILVHLEESETGLPMRFLIKGSQADDNQEEGEL